LIQRKKNNNSVNIGAYLNPVVLSSILKKAKVPFCSIFLYNQVWQTFVGTSWLICIFSVFTVYIGLGDVQILERTLLQALSQPKVTQTLDTFHALTNTCTNIWLGWLSPTQLIFLLRHWSKQSVCAALGCWHKRR
jgi:hypothetical protein